MPFLPASIDGARLHYVDYTPASTPAAFRQPEVAKSPGRITPMTLVFIHGWPMSSLMYEQHMLTICETNRIRCIGIDRRGFGKSEWCGVLSGETGRAEITYETFAKDTIDVLGSLKLDGDFAFVAASMGCGETVLAYKLMTREMKQKCTGMVWLGPNMPFPLQTENNQLAPPRELWDSILAGFRHNRGGFVKASLPGVFTGTNPKEISIDEGVVRRFEYIVDQADALAIERCVRIITARDFTEDLRSLSQESGLKILVLHGDSDQGSPYEASSKLIAKLMPLLEVKIYENAAHGLYATHVENVVEDILGFLKNL